MKINVVPIASAKQAPPIDLWKLAGMGLPSTTMRTSDSNRFAAVAKSGTRGQTQSLLGFQEPLGGSISRRLPIAPDQLRLCTVSAVQNGSALKLWLEGPANEDQIQKVREQMEGFDTAVLFTQGKNAAGHALSLVVARVDENCGLWFFTVEGLAKEMEIEADACVQVICQNGSSSRVVVEGRATLVRDPAMIRALWKSAFRMWFPQGVNDPNLVLIHCSG